MRSFAYNIEQIETPQAEQPLVASIMTIIALSSAMTNTRRCKMDEPPEAQKEYQQQAIQVIARAHVRVFPLPASALHILKRRFYSHSQSILFYSFSPGRLI